jgi:fatty-acid desaturase
MSLQSLSFNAKVRGLQAINHILLVVGLFYMISTSQWHSLWISLAVYILMLPIGTVCGLHRLLAHKSYKTSKFWERTFSICSIYATIGSTITWVALHRLHHTTAEKINDPHSPYIGRAPGEVLKFSFKQAFKSWIGVWKIANIPPRFAIDLIHDPFHSFIHKHYFKIILGTCVLLALVDPWLIVFAYSIPACLSLHATSVIIVIAHVHGYKTHKISDESRNSWISTIVTLGDGWHNNHHAHPGSWTTKEKWWEFDPCGFLIKHIKTN